MENLLEKIKKDLSVNYNNDDDEILKEIISNFTTIAVNETNLKPNNVKLEPYIYNAVKSAYLRRGKEGSISNSEGGLSDNYVDIEEKLRKDLRSIRILP